MAEATVCAVWMGIGKVGTTDETGRAELDIGNGDREMTVQVAASGCGAVNVSGWKPSGMLTLAVDAPALPTGGSVLLSKGGGRIPGVAGTVNPIKDDLGTFVHANGGLTIDGGEVDPFEFALNKDFLLTDVYGHSRKVRVLAIEGRMSLLEYRRA